MKNKLFQALLSSLYLFSCISGALHIRTARKNLFIDKCVDNTWAFIYNDVRYKDIIASYESDPAFMVSMRDITAGRIDASNAQNLTIFLSLDSKDIKGLSMGPFKLSPVNKGKLDLFIESFKTTTGSDLKFVFVPHGTPTKIIQAFMLANVTVLFKPVNVINHETDLNTFTLKGAVLVDLSKNGLDSIVMMGKFLDKTDGSSKSIKECLGITPIRSRASSSTLDFETKKQRLRAIVDESETSERWEIERENVIEDSYRYWELNSRTAFLGRMRISFRNEPGIDLTGLYKDWLSQVFATAFGNDSKYFDTISIGEGHVVPSTKSFSEQKLKHFEFLGSFVGKAVRNGNVVGTSLPNFLLRLMVNQKPRFHDLAHDDPEMFNSFRNIEQISVDGLDMFSFEYTTKDENNRNVNIELKPDGSNITGTDDNKFEYMLLRFKAYVDTPQIKRFVKGFRDLVKPRFDVDIFKFEELDMILCGPGSIDVQDWMNNTEYGWGYSRYSPQIVWFWEMVNSFDNVKRKKLLKFVTGLSNPPLQGFAHLLGNNGIRKFNITTVVGGDPRMPTTHTCFNQLDLPEYSSKRIMTQKFLVAIEANNFGFG